jgi:hypothetical protein
MAAIDGHITEAEIGEAVEGKTTDKRTALRQLVEAGKLRREGSGKKGDPYRYSLSEKCLFPCSQHIPETRKSRIGKNGLSVENTSEMLVPANLEKSGESSESREQESRRGWLPGIAPFNYPD